MSAPTRESLLQQLAAEREKRQADRLAVLLGGNVRCGRIDDHTPHEWTRPRLFGVGRPVRYWCKGPGVIEGGAR